MIFGKSADASPTNVEQLLLTARLVFESVLTLASSTRAHQFMDAPPYGCSLLISAEACSHVAYTCSLTRTVSTCTDDSNKADSVFAVPAWCEEDETATEGLLPIHQWNNQRNEQLKHVNNRSIAGRADDSKDW
jgi:hypothetical protein